MYLRQPQILPFVDLVTFGCKFSDCDKAAMQYAWKLIDIAHKAAFAVTENGFSMNEVDWELR